MTRSTRPPVGNGSMAAYFAYGTLQAGFPNHGPHARDLGPPRGRFRTVASYPLVVPHAAACPNPGCTLEHRVCALIDEPGIGHHVEGEVYEVTDAALRRLDALESYRADDESGSAFLRRRILVEPADGNGGRLTCEVYFIADPSGYRRLLEERRAEMVPRYELGMARGRLKSCCRQRPGHPPPHDVSDPFGPDRTP